MSGASESALQRVAGRTRLMVGRAILALVNDAAKLQTVQVEVQAGVVRDKAEHFQHYGFTSAPLPGAEGIALAVGGSTDHTVVINIDDRRYRLVGLQPGEAALYDDLGHKITLTRAGIVVDGGGHPVTMTNLTKLRVEAGIESTGEIKDRCDSGGKTMASMRTAYNGHKHPETGAITNTPDTAM